MLLHPSPDGRYYASRSPHPQCEDPDDIGRSRPITIELPGLRRANNSGLELTPPEPLSARGDVRGGYFPLHEDPDLRIHRPHPFHNDAEKARNRSISLAAEAISPSHEPASSGGSDFVHSPGSTADSAHSPSVIGLDSLGARSKTPVTSYLPNGSRDSPLPMGKYYPSNWEKRSNLGRQRPSLLPLLSTSAAGTSRPDLQVPKHYSDMSRPWSSKEAVQRLRQYQRDIIAQTTLAAKSALSSSRTPTTIATASMATISQVNFQLGQSMANRPAAPQLMPLGSPGPVTPMELEGSGEVVSGYLTRGRLVPGLDAGCEGVGMPHVL